MKGRKGAVLITVIAAFILTGTGIAAVSMNRTTGKKLGTETEPEINATDTDLKEETNTEEVETAVTESEAEQPEENDNAPSEAKQEPSGSTAQAAPQGSNNNGGANSSTGTPTTQPASAGSNTPVQQPTVSETNIPPTQQPAGNGGNSQPQQPVATTTEHTSVWHEPVYKDVWVVDVPAHTEEIPEYETRCRSVCNGCGADVTNDPIGHGKTQMLAGNMSCGGYHTEYYDVQIGTTTLNYPEEGHWEKVLVKEGYWE